MRNKFRAVFIPSFEAVMADKKLTPFHSEQVGSYEAARDILDNIANYTLFLHDASLMPDYSNTGWIEQFVDGEWEEFDDD